jgi:hypothetical protein
MMILKMKMQVEIQTPSKCSLTVSCISVQVTCSDIMCIILHLICVVTNYSLYCTSLVCSMSRKSLIFQHCIRNLKKKLCKKPYLRYSGPKLGLSITLYLLLTDVKRDKDQAGENCCKILSIFQSVFKII